jgi:hypothetical protein
MKKVIAPSIGDVTTILAKELRITNPRTVTNVSVEALDAVPDEKRYLIYIQFSEKGNPVFVSKAAAEKIATVFVLRNKTYGNESITLRTARVNKAVVIEVKIGEFGKMFKNYSLS